MDTEIHFKLDVTFSCLAFHLSSERDFKGRTWAVPVGSKLFHRLCSTQRISENGQFNLLSKWHQHGFVSWKLRRFHLFRKFFGF